MANIGLISCVSKKLSKLTEAKNLYVSPLFAKSRIFVEQHCDSWFILSAKYGLIEPTDVIAPYEETLNTKSRHEKDEWARRVWVNLRQHLNPDDHVTILAGENYRKNLVPLILNHGSHVDVPMQGLGIGRQLQWLSNQPTQKRDINRFYKALHKLESNLGGKRSMSASTGQQKWPDSGVYFFFEPGEMRANLESQRVVRVGTHRVSAGSKAKLWNRLRTHRGTRKGTGKHRSSIFRLHVGNAISKKYPNLAIPSWGIRGTRDKTVLKTEINLERKASSHIGKMGILWLAIEDKAGPASDRAYIERNLIGMLAGKSYPVDPPSANWLGQFNPEERIKLSGLWNLDHLDYPYSPDFLDILEEYVLITIGKRPKPTGSIAPSNWHENK